MKILQVNKLFYPRSGAENSVLRLCALLENYAHQVIPFGMSHEKNVRPGYAEDFVENIEYDKEVNSSIFRKLFLGLKVIYSCEARKKITALIARERPDVAHIHKFNNTLTPSILYALKERGVPVVQTFRDFRTVCPNYNLYDFNRSMICEACKGHKYYNALIRKCQKSSYLVGLNIAIESYMYNFMKTYEKTIDLYICTSRFVMGKMVQFGIDKNKMVHIPNFLDPAQYTPEYGSEGYILYFGRIEKHKGIKTLLRSMKYVKSSKLVVAGQGSYLDELIAYRKENAIDNVMFIGHKEGNEMKQIIRNSLFTVIPSEWYEPFGLVIIESFASGKPVIGADIGGISELIEDGNDGLLFEAGNADILTDKINYLLDNRKLVKEMGRNARKKVEEKYNPDLHYERLMEAYQRVL